MECPKCGAVAQPKTVECPRCGVILAKASAYVPPRNVYQPPMPAAPASSPKSSVSTGGVMLAAAAVVLLWLGWRTVSARISSSASAGNWYLNAGGYERAISEQKSSSKPVLLYFHTEWCGYCSMLEKDVFSTSTFASRYGSILKVKVNPDVGSAERSIAQQYSVTGFPTVYVIAGGSVREPIVGYAPPEQYLAALERSIGD